MEIGRVVFKLNELENEIKRVGNFLLANSLRGLDKDKFDFSNSYTLHGRYLTLHYMNKFGDFCAGKDIIVSSLYLEYNDSLILELEMNKYDGI